MSVTKKKTLQITVADNIGLVEFTRPKEMNSFIREQYLEMAEALESLATNDDAVIVVITASGEFYSSGHDLKAMMSLAAVDDLEAVLTKSVREQADRVIKVMIDFPKPIICGVNGPAVGFACTTTQLCDVTYCSDTAHFEVPFMKLGFCAEGLSSLLFPEVLGQSKANEVLLLGKKLSAEEAEKVSKELPLQFAALFPEAFVPTVT